MALYFFKIVPFIWLPTSTQQISSNCALSRSLAALALRSPVLLTVVSVEKLRRPKDLCPDLGMRKAGRGRGLVKPLSPVFALSEPLDWGAVPYSTGSQSLSRLYDLWNIQLNLILPHLSGSKSFLEGPIVLNADWASQKKLD